MRPDLSTLRKKVPASTKLPQIGQSSLKTSSRRTLGGIRVPEDFVLERPYAAAAHHTLRTVTAAPVLPSVTAGRNTVKPQAARSLSSVTLPSQSETGENTWWEFDEDDIPGVGQYHLNDDAASNVLVQSSDMSVRHRWVDLTFTRSYNSLSQHDYAGTDGSVPSSYGNGWTNNFDAHAAANTGANGTFGISVYDIDGARYDYLPTDSTGNTFSAPAGSKDTSLVPDSTHCTYYWTKRTGLMYQFRTPVTDRTKACAVTPKFAATAGRLVTVYGRNQRSQLGFNYVWNTDSSTPAHLAQIQVTIDGVQTAATLNFATFGTTCAPAQSYQLLSSLQQPDGTITYYQYDCSGNLTEVDKPSGTSMTACQPPPAVTGCRRERYAYTGTHFLSAVAGPRWGGSLTNDQDLTTGTDGGYVAFVPAAGTNGVAEIDHIGVMNPTVNDGTTATAAHASSNLPANRPFTYRRVLVQHGSGTTTVSDTDGRGATYGFDSLGRVTSVTFVTNHGYTTTTLTRSQQWDANNDLTALTDFAGDRTDFGYDAQGDLIAEAAPSETSTVGDLSAGGTSQTFRATTLYAYDAHFNLVGFCEPVLNQSAGHNWDGVSAPPACPTAVGSAGAPGGQVFRYADVTGAGYEPFGELTDAYNPSGYHEHYTYSPGSEGGTSGNSGVDFGSPTTIQGDSFTENGAPYSPTVQYVYNANGQAVCANKGNGWSTTSYDANGRVIQKGDADDSTLSPAQCPKSSGIPGVTTAATLTETHYYPDGDIYSTQNATERAAGVTSNYTYDNDDDVTSMALTVGGGQRATTTVWYDGADRPIVVRQPSDPSDIAPHPPLVRYVYDLSQNGSLETLGLNQSEVGIANNGFQLQAYGNLYKTQKYLNLPSSNGPSQYNGNWYDTVATTYDGIDRPTGTYNASLKFAWVERLLYDLNPNSQGLLSSEVNYNSEGFSSTETQADYTYDKLQRVVDRRPHDGFFPNNETKYTYDADSRPSSTQQIAAFSHYAIGTETMTYDPQGHPLCVTDPPYTDVAEQGSTSLLSAYYPNGNRASLFTGTSCATAAGSTPLLSYTYRPDGLAASQTGTLGATSARFSWTYTPGGRMLTQSDPLNGKPIANASGGTANHGLSQSSFARTAAEQAQPSATPVAIPSSPPASAATSISITAKLRAGATPYPAAAQQALAQPASVAASGTFGPKTFAYGASGQITQLTLPFGGVYSSFLYDEQGNNTGYTGFAAPADTTDYPGASLAVHIGTRGDLVGARYFTAASGSSFDTNWPHFSFQNLGGTQVPKNEWPTVGGSTVQVAYNLDPLSGVLGQQFAQFSSNGVLGPIGTPVSNFVWLPDYLGRLTTGTYQGFWQLGAGYTNTANMNRVFDTDDNMFELYVSTQTAGGGWPAAPFTPFTCNAPPPPINTNVIAPGTFRYGWNANGHPFIDRGQGLHWDGNDLLFSTDRGGINDLKVGRFADITPDGSVEVIDRDPSGFAVMTHSANGFSAWTPPNPFNGNCIATQSSPAQPAGYRSTLQTHALPFSEPGPDGFFDQINFFQGRRIYDPQMGQWASRDGDPGQLLDPMSQQPYLWDNGNSMSASDPSGDDDMYMNLPFSPIMPTLWPTTQDGAQACSQGVAACGDYFSDLLWGPPHPLDMFDLMTLEDGGIGNQALRRGAHELPRLAAAITTTRMYAKSVEMMHALAYGGRQQVHFPTPFGSRFVDLVTPGKIHEVKSGMQFATDRNRRQMLKDAWIGGNTPGADPEWHFYAGIFGTKGPSQTLHNELLSHGITVVIH